MSLSSSAAVCQATPGDKPFNFVALPLEVKELIYKHALFAGGHLKYKLYVNSGHFANSALQNSFPAICFTNKLERIIASRLYLRYQTITMDDSDDSPVLEAFLSQFGQANEGLGWLKHVEIAYYGDFCDYISKAIPLIRVCTALKTVVFRMNSLHLYGRSERGPAEKKPSTGAEIFERLRLHGLADCGHLTKVRFHVFRGRRAELEGLKKLIQDFSCDFLALHGSIASKKLDVGISDECGLIWVLEPQA
ncbi:uncharacterized protein J4E88_010702 [Alternaria novae-zelandiae]|uniref:uncharacterized protein n=1 Tax=Alternaria novae-zelandiae TaxID=430562 RepID=UPI0020C4D68A|nr:uncharacterized protein J4E88_010702 [Alternaria novae-zelandiae]KAI4664450.1 hypothetical protein J4E88_010702 [Alternaria novae-zelandiae]